MATTERPSNEYFPPLITANGYQIPFERLINIDPDNLAAEYETHAGWQATIAFAHTAARAKADSFERFVRRKEAALSFTLRSNMEREIRIKPTVDSIKAALLCDDDLQKLEDELGELRRVEKELEVARNAFLARKDMLINLGAHERADMRAA